MAYFQRKTKPSIFRPLIYLARPLIYLARPLIYLARNRWLGLYQKIDGATHHDTALLTVFDLV